MRLGVSCVNKYLPVGIIPVPVSDRFNTCVLICMAVYAQCLQVFHVAYSTFGSGFDVVNVQRRGIAHANNLLVKDCPDVWGSPFVLIKF